jgi:hypothetical protein
VPLRKRITTERTKPKRRPFEDVLPRCLQPSQQKSIVQRKTPIGAVGSALLPVNAGMKTDAYCPTSASPTMKSHRTDHLDGVVERASLYFIRAVLDVLGYRGAREASL